MSNSRPRPFAALVALTLLGQFMLLAYEIALTRRFGTTADADVLALTFIIAFALANEVAGWIGVLLIPHYLRIGAREGWGAVGGVLSAVFLATMLATGGVAICTIAVAPGLAFLAIGRAGAAGLLRLFSPLIVLLPAAAVLANALQARERFALAALRPLMWYGAAFIAVLFASDAVGPAAIPLGMTVGLTLYIFALWVATRHFMRRTTAAAWSQVRSLMPVLVPLVAMSVANYLQVLVERGLAGHLATGSLAALTYAFRLVNAPITLLVLTAATILFPVMSAQAVREGPSGMGELAGRALRISVVLTVPGAGLLMAYAEPVVRVIFERGAFTPESSRLTGLALFYYAPALVGLTALQLLIRAYWALRAIGGLARIQIGAAVFGVVAMVVLTSAIGFRGLPIAVSLTSLVHSAALLLGLRREIPGFVLGPFLALTGRVCTAATVATGVAITARWLVNGPFFQLATGLPIGALVYLALIGRMAPLAWRETRRLIALRS